VSGYVYFIGCNWGNSSDLRVKIGFTRRHPEQRCQDFQPGAPEVLDVLCYTPGDIALERKFHATFDACRIHNEWFCPFGLMDRFIRRIMQEGRGARCPTDFEIVKRAMFEEVYDWAPSPDVDEDWPTLLQSASPAIWNADFAGILAERLARIREKRREAV